METYLDEQPHQLPPADRKVRIWHSLERATIGVAALFVVGMLLVADRKPVRLGSESLHRWVQIETESIPPAIP